MRKVIFTLLLLPIVSFSQNISIKGGLSYSKQTYQGASHKYKMSFSGGVTYNYKFNDHFSFYPGLILRNRGFTNDLFIFTDKNGSVLPKNDFKHTIGYLSIEPLSKLNVKNLYFTAGPTAGIKFYASSTKINGISVFDDANDQSFLIGYQTGIGYKFGKSFIEIEYLRDFSRKEVSNYLFGLTTGISL